jgi:hypothetical protein
MKSGTEQNISGLWRNSAMGFNMDLNLQTNGKGTFDEEAISYQFTGSALIISSGSSKTTYQAKLAGDDLTLSGGDLDAPILFTRVGAIGNAKSNVSSGSSSPPSNAGSSLVGTWIAQNEEITFTHEGKMIYNGAPLSYSLQSNQIVVQAPAGNITFEYTLNGNYLTLKSEGLNAMYTRKTGSTTTSQAAIPAQPNVNAGDGIIDQTLVGKWSYVGTANNISGTFSNEEYVTLHANGTYEYYSETSGTASGTNMYGNQTFAGGTASQSADRGTWRVNGNTIIATSQKTGVKVYQLQKRNHPKTGDPMIVLDGTAYVTYYQKAPWR